jgi:hypothetical protein
VTPGLAAQSRARSSRNAARLFGTLGLLAVLAAAGPARADAVTQEIDRARTAYSQGKFADAKQSLELAAQLVSQQKARLLNNTLPPPFLGWNVDKPADAGAADAITPTGAIPAGNNLLGGITATRTYRKASKACALTVAGDSPLLTVVSMFLANPTVAQASGARMQRIGNQRAIITQDNEVEVMSANNYLVTVAGDCDLADKIAYAGAVDYVRLASF